MTLLMTMGHLILYTVYLGLLHYRIVVTSALVE